jgi:hypothetical protein
MNAILPILIIVVVCAASGMALLVMVIAAIHGEERHLSLSGPPRTRAENAARRVLGVHVSQPVAIRVFAAHRSGDPAADVRAGGPHRARRDAERTGSPAG